MHTKELGIESLLFRIQFVCTCTYIVRNACYSSAVYRGMLLHTASQQSWALGGNILKIIKLHKTFNNIEIHILITTRVSQAITDEPLANVCLCSCLPTATVPTCTHCHCAHVYPLHQAILLCYTVLYRHYCRQSWMDALRKIYATTQCPFNFFFPIIISV